ncbi:flagellar hook-length control protein FliK [Neorhizobium sp. DAR64861/K0K2]|uniref:flagellar hook-length control protein FliK n=1 Tax=unclassified Neorhizobium TaxID=2629175 RepID=UPI003D29547A
MMTNVANASVKTVSDGPVGNLFGKASSQNGEAGQFAQVLTDADADTGKTTEDGKPVAEDGSESGTVSLGSSRFKSLTDLTSLAANFKATDPAETAPPSNATPTPATAEVPIADPQLQLQQPAAQPVPAPTTDVAVKDNLGGKTSPEVPSGQDQTGSQDPASGQIDVTQLVAAATKRVATATVENGKAKAADPTSRDVTDDQGEGAELAAAGPDLTAALSTAALLNLTASVETGNPAQSADIAAVSAMISVTETGIPNDKTDATMPSDDTDAATSFDFLDTGEAEPQTDVKSYRFQKAGDAIAAVSLSIVTGADGGSDLQDSLPGTANTETVTVLDSRRYLGFGVGENASNLLSAASSNREWTAAMQPSSALTDPTRSSGTGSVVNTLKLQLTPDNLGTVTAHMRLVGDQLSIHLTVHSSMAYRELSDDSKPMLDALRAQGFNVDQVTVSMAPSTDSSNSSADQQQGGSGAQTQQQLARDGEAARQQGQAQGGRSNDGNRNDMEKRNETVVETDIGSTGTGDIYL